MTCGAVAVLSLWTLAGCEDPVSPPRNPSVREWVTGAAATALDRDGHFVFPPTSIQSPYATITEARAAALALAYVRTFASSPSFLNLLEGRHGSKFDLATMTADARVEFAETPYEPVPLDYSAYDRDRAGPAFFVRLLNRGMPAVSVSVSAHLTELAIGANGKFVPPSTSEGFEATGIPVGSGWSYPISPESATIIVARATGAKVEQLPALLRPHRTYGDLFARWKLRLDRAVTVRSLASSITQTTDSLFAADSRLYVPAAVQRGADTLTVGNTILVFQIKPGMPVYFDEVVVVR